MAREGADSGGSVVGREEILEALSEARQTVHRLEGLLAKFPQPKHREHPDDRRDRLASQRAAAKTIREFCRLRANQLRLTVQTYADVDAHAGLERLRDEFWGSKRWSK